MKTNIVTDTSPPIPYLAEFWVSSYETNGCQPIKLHGSLKWNISRKKWMMNFIFLMQVNMEVFYKLIPSFWVCVNRHAQSTQNKFVYLAISLEKHWDEIDFFSADKHTSSLQIDTMILMMMVKHSQSSQNSKFAMFLQYLKEDVRTSWHYCCWWKLPGTSKVPKIGSWQNFCNILKKSTATSFVLYCDLKHSDILWRSSHVCCYLLLHVHFWVVVVKYGCNLLDLRTQNFKTNWWKEEWIDESRRLIFCMLIQI